MYSKMDTRPWHLSSVTLQKIRKENVYIWLDANISANFIVKWIVTLKSANGRKWFEEDQTEHT